VQACDCRWSFTTCPSAVGQGDVVGAGRLRRSGSGRSSMGMARGIVAGMKDKGKLSARRGPLSNAVDAPIMPVSRIPGPFANLLHSSFLATSCRTEASKGRLGVSHIPQSMYVRSALMTCSFLETSGTSVFSVEWHLLLWFSLTSRIQGG
jgi:hypothetical protein